MATVGRLQRKNKKTKSSPNGLSVNQASLWFICAQLKGPLWLTTLQWFAAFLNWAFLFLPLASFPFFVCVKLEDRDPAQKHSFNTAGTKMGQQEQREEQQQELGRKQKNKLCDWPPSRWRRRVLICITTLGAKPRERISTPWKWNESLCWTVKKKKSKTNKDKQKRLCLIISECPQGAAAIRK